MCVGLAGCGHSWPVVIKRPTIDRLSQKFADLKSLSAAQLGERWMTFLLADAQLLAWPPLQALDSALIHWPLDQCRW